MQMQQIEPLGDWTLCNVNSRTIYKYLSRYKDWLVVLPDEIKESKFTTKKECEEHAKLSLGPKLVIPGHVVKKFFKLSREHITLRKAVEAPKDPNVETGKPYFCAYCWSYSGAVGRPFVIPLHEKDLYLKFSQLYDEVVGNSKLRLSNEQRLVLDTSKMPVALIEELKKRYGVNEMRK